MTAGSEDATGNRNEDNSAVGDRDTTNHEEFMQLLSARKLAVERPSEPTNDETIFETSPENSPETVFPQSVASGSPTSTGVVLWTRIDPEAYDPNRVVALEVARTEDFEAIVHQGICDVNHDSLSGRDHTVKVDLDGELEPNEEYAFRFVHGDTSSQIGRCRTLPDPDANPDSIRFAVMCCQDYLNGHSSLVKTHTSVA